MPLKMCRQKWGEDVAAIHKMLYGMLEKDCRRGLRVRGDQPIYRYFEAFIEVLHNAYECVQTGCWTEAGGPQGPAPLPAVTYWPHPLYFTTQEWIHRPRARVPLQRQHALAGGLA